MQQGTRNALLVVDTIPGPGQVQTPEGFDNIRNGIWIESISCSGMQRAAQMATPEGEAGDRARQVSLDPVSIIKKVDSSSTAIFNSMLTARRFPEMHLYVIRPYGNGTDRLVYFSIALGHAAFQSQTFISQQGEDGFLQMSEQLTIVYNTIQYKYADETWTPGSNRGTYESATWNQATHAMA